MKRTLKWAVVPAFIAAAAAMSPVSVSSSNAGVVGVEGAICMDCMEDTRYTCGNPPLDREDHCTVGETWCTGNVE